MKIKSIALTLFLFLFLSIGNILVAQTNIDNDKNLSKSQKDLITKYVAGFPDNTQLSITIITDNNVNCIGIEKINNTLVSIHNRDSVFEIGSITKLFTSTLLANLVKEKIINLDDPIETVLPYQLKQTVKDRSLITFKTLANHTSGLPRLPDNIAMAYDSIQLRYYLQKQLNLSSVPGEKYSYSNLGAGLLGYLLELKTGKSYEQLLHDMIFSKYDMSFTSSELDKVIDLVVQGRDSSGNIIPNYQSDILKAAGGILSNVKDLSYYVMANFTSDSILAFQRQKTYTRDGGMDLALGWHIKKFGGGTYEWYFHNGGMDGYRSCLYMDKNTKSAVIILSNLSAFHPQSGNIDQLCSDLLKEVFLAKAKENPSLCEAPFIEMALNKGWGTHKNDSIKQLTKSGKRIVGVWQKQLSGRTITRTFMPDNKVQSDFMDDPEIDIWGYYQLKGKEIEFKDIGGAACNNPGHYKYRIHAGKLTFTLIDDSCDGRSSGLSGIWTREK